MSENKIARVPVASHGLHKHSYNYPWLSSLNFGDVMPCYYNTIRKGERDNPKAGLYSQLMPIAHNAFATGRYNFKSIFVPYKMVWLPWYSFDQQIPYDTAQGTQFRPQVYPFVEDGVLSVKFCQKFGTADGSSTDFDIGLNPFGNTNLANVTYYHLSDAGRRVLRILGSLGCTPSFIEGDKATINILPLMCYIKAFADYYFPNNYVGGSEWLKLIPFFGSETIDFTSRVADLLDALEVCSLNFYENSVFDLCWDNPVTPNVSNVSPIVSIDDVSDPDHDINGNVNNQDVSVGTPSAYSATGSFTQFMINALKSISMWARRRQLSGARLIDKFLVSRGVSLPNDSARMSYFLGQRNIEIEVSGVENNTDENLGELAGRGVASTGNQPLSFECRPDDDGIFFVIVSPIPDSNFPVYRDGFSLRKDFLDNYTAEYDKLGSSLVSKRCVFHAPNGIWNDIYYNQTPSGGFGFLNQYWDEVQEKPRLLGDFTLPSRGAQELRAYHTFRLLLPSTQPADFAHSYDFIRMSDSGQYQRLFYSSDQENLMLFLRWYGDQYKEKLPLGDSYEWDDDEMNRRVSVVVGGSQK